MDIETPTRLAEIRRMNHQFRTTFRGGQILLTSSIAELPDMVKASALEKVATFKDFNEENDPHEEHDYGSFDHCNREVWFKICASPTGSILPVEPIPHVLEELHHKRRRRC